MAYFIDCTTLPLAIVIFLGYGAFYSFGICGFFTSQLSVAPQYTGILFSILKIASVLGSVIAVELVGFINIHVSCANSMIGFNSPIFRELKQNGLSSG